MKPCLVQQKIEKPCNPVVLIGQGKLLESSHYRLIDRNTLSHPLNPKWPREEQQLSHVAVSESDFLRTDFET